MSHIPVAEYVRMSTEDQKYSIPSQQAAIRQYAAEHSFFVSRTYSDPGRSGVLLKHRPGLNQLLQDVLSGATDYKAILVYDVSRWGRFQNPDESAHYEFICANAGVPVHYCAEQFSNDGTVQSTLMKAIKRTMAGEFSRELGVKVFDATKRLVLEGFHGGGVAPYGLERMLISSSGRKKGKLPRGEAKNLKSDRVVLVRGRRGEIRNVQKVFAMCATENKTMSQIAARLNAKHSTWRSQPWDADKVLRIIRSPVYLGLNVWGKRSLKLHGPNIKRPKAQWTISKARFKPIVDRATFDKAHKAIAARRIHYDCTELLTDLRLLLARKRRLSLGIVDSSKETAHAATYRRHFGSLLNAYELAGYKPETSRYVAVGHTRTVNHLHKAIVAKIQKLFPTEVETLRCARGQKYVIQVDGQFRVSVLMASRRCDGHNCNYWFLRVSDDDRNNIALICTLDKDWKDVMGYYLLKPLKRCIRKRHRLHENDPLLRLGIKLSSLEDFCQVVRRLGAQDAAWPQTADPYSDRRVKC